jgi:NAD(P)H-nitrite reductase large subunit
MNEQHKTYLSLPLFHAGQVNLDDFKRIAALAEKYQPAQIKLTAAQQVAFLGKTPEAMDALKAELQIPPSSLYARGLVSYVKACPGSLWCKYGQRDSLLLGERIKKIQLDAALPWKVKVGISGCRFSCAGSMVCDVGLTAEKKGWRFSFGGNGAAVPRIADVVAVGLDDDEAVELVTKTLNYYIQEAKGKIRTARFMERYGVEAVKEALLGGIH